MRFKLGAAGKAFWFRFIELLDARSGKFQIQ